MSAAILMQVQALEQAAEELRKTQAFLKEVMGDAIEDCGLLESVALLASQRENARNAHARTQERCDRLETALKSFVARVEDRVPSLDEWDAAPLAADCVAARSILGEEAK